MGHFRAKEVARRLITGGILLTVIVTTFLPSWVTQATTTPVLAENNNETSYTAGTTVVDRPPNSISQRELAPMNALILSEPGRVETIRQAITEAGGYVYILQGDALFVGLDRLSYQELAPIGARAVYQGIVSEADLAALPERDRSAVETWNQMKNPEQAASNDSTLSTNRDEDLLLIPNQDYPASSAARAGNAPTNADTSTFMVGSVTVEVVFVESTGTTENWTADEISKAKGEISSALQWWTVAANAPDDVGNLRPSARLTWKVNYHSPVEDNKVKVSVEPITRSIAYAATDGNWISEIAAKYAGGAENAATVRTWADKARDTGKTDWGLILYVVDSSKDTDGKFSDDMIAGAPVSGPWVVVSSEGVQSSLSNLEIIIAKMIGHAFGAGDETYDGTLGCNIDEYYGYLHIKHTNCKESNQEQSLMRSGSNMISAYRNYQLSQPAREQVGWRDNDGNGIYDVMDTLSDNLSSIYASLSFVCPNMHFSNIAIYNDPALPIDFADHGDENGWISQIYDPGTQNIVNGVVYHQTNINWAGYVWGRLNGGDWIGAKPKTLTWSQANEEYNLVLPGTPSTNNNDVDVVIMNRWEQEVFETQLTDIPIPPSWSSTDKGENDDTNAVQFFNAKGGTEGWTEEPVGHEITYTSEIGAEACFGFQGTEVTLWHSLYASGGGKANVFVDGKLNSIIDYKNDTIENHVVSNLTNDNHVVRLVVSGAGVVDFDAFEITDSSADNVIYGKAADGNPIDTGSGGFYEQSGAKLQFKGIWTSVGWSSITRQGTPDNRGKKSIRPMDRIYAYFTQADTVAIYRRVYSGGGSADVYLNGVYQGTMKNHSTKSMITPYYISGLNYTQTNTVEIRINNTGDKMLIFDALRLMNLRDHTKLYKVVPSGPGDLPEPLAVVANGAQEKYGAWAVKSGYIESDDQGDVTNVYFQGSAITIKREMGSTYRQMEIYVDGVLKKTLNNAGSAATSVPTTIHGLDPNLPHVLQVRLFYSKAGSAALNRIRGYTVHYFEPVTSGSYEEYEYTDGKPVRSDFAYEDWWTAPKTVTGPSGGHFVETKNTKSRAYLYFTEVDTLSVYGVAGSIYGAADIYVNGTLKGRFTQQSSTTGYKKYLTITGLTKTAINVLEIRVNTTVKNLPRVISLDRVVLYNKLVLTAGTYQNNGATTVGGSTFKVPYFQFSGQWKRVTDSKASGSSMDVVQSSRDVVAFGVTQASSITIYRRLASSYGMADVYVDGELYTSFNNYSSVSGGLYKQPFEIIGLDPNFNHEIRIQPRVTGSSFTKFDIDYIVVGGTFDPDYLPDGKWQQNNATYTANKAIQYIGSWNKSNSSWYTSTSPGARVMVLFQGNAFSTYYRRGSDGGIFDLYIDGVRYQRVNTRASTAVANIPISVSGLTKGLHTAEIVVVSDKVYIDAYEVYAISAVVGPVTYVLKDAVPSERVVFSGRWTISGNYRRAVETGASIAIYAKNGDTLSIVRQAKPGIIDIYVDGVRRTSAESYVTDIGVTTETFTVSGLIPMLTTGTWIELRARSGEMVSLSQLKIGSLSPKMGVGCSFEAEDLTKGKAAGYWLKRPTTPNTTNFFGGKYLISQSQMSRYYVAVQGIDYLTVYRALSPSWGSANIYIDGEPWGSMSGYAAKAAYKVPFQIGPLPEDTASHIIEFRQTSNKPYGLDKFECFTTSVLGPGYYENQHSGLTKTGYVGTWTNMASTNASGGRVHQTSQKGARVTVRFSGNKLTIYRTTTKDGNLMKATVDGKTYPISNLSTSTRYRVPYTILLPESTVHSLELIVESGVVNFDALEVGTAVPGSFGSYQEKSPQVVVNDKVNMWTQTSSAKHSGGSHLITTKKYSSVQFLFSGRRVTTYMTRGADWGKVRFLLDGKTVEVVDLYAKGTDNPFFAYDISGLELGTHVIELRFEGAKSSLGKARANFDVFSVDGAPVPHPDQMLPPGDPDTGNGGNDDDGIPTEGCFEEARQDLWTFAGDWAMFSDGGASGYQNPDTPEVPGGEYYYAEGDPESPTPGDVYAQFSFKAEGFGLAYHKQANGAITSVFIDDMEIPYISSLSMYDEDSLWLADALLTRTGLDPEVVHVVRIAYSGTSEGGDYIYIDRIDLPEYDPAYNDNCLAR